MSQLSWNNLLNSDRRKPSSNQTLNEKRLEIERDYDRILFCAPIRRLADKTQVFPLEKNDSVRTRLTHSYEVSNLARGIGTRLAYDHSDLFQDYIVANNNNSDSLKRNLPSLLATIGLTHDLGNPPFGHQGERAMAGWFKQKIDDLILPDDTIDTTFEDFKKFDGNSQTLRLVTRLQILNDDYGLNLTYATLSALIKYPHPSSITKGKHGFFNSEDEIVKEIWEKTGLKEGQRHPLTYIMEACDDIAYSVIDAEDIVKKGLASFYDLIQHLETVGSECSLTQQLIKDVSKKTDDLIKTHTGLSPNERNDLSMQLFRVYAIRVLVNSVIEEFIKQHDTIMKEKDIFTNTLSDGLMSISSSQTLCRALKSFDKKWGYRNKSVLKLELEGNFYINKVMDMLWQGIHGHYHGNLSLDKNKNFKNNTPFGKYIYERISENYRRIYESQVTKILGQKDQNKVPEQLLYAEFQLLADAVSGMTDRYLVSLYSELIALNKE